MVQQHWRLRSGGDIGCFKLLCEMQVHMRMYCLLCLFCIYEPSTSTITRQPLPVLSTTSSSRRILKIAKYNLPGIYDNRKAITKRDWPMRYRNQDMVRLLGYGWTITVIWLSVNIPTTPLSEQYMQFLHECLDLASNVWSAGSHVRMWEVAMSDLYRGYGSMAFFSTR